MEYMRYYNILFILITHSGKTYTMYGAGGGGRANSTPGLYLLTAKDILNTIESQKYQHLRVFVSFFEIYGGKVFDLLNNRDVLRCLEDKNKMVRVVGLKEIKCLNIAQLKSLMETGNSQRSTGSTGANLDSSRSHAILQFCLKDIRKRVNDLFL